MGELAKKQVRAFRTYPGLERGIRTALRDWLLRRTAETFFLPKRAG
jgi:hypothetical protein